MALGPRAPHAPATGRRRRRGLGRGRSGARLRRARPRHQISTGKALAEVGGVEVGYLPQGFGGRPEHIEVKAGPLSGRTFLWHPEVGLALAATVVADPADSARAMDDLAHLVRSLRVP
ncbi:hypothetical protein [Microbispora siamensis]|uniref:Uncharacterized protein n=1 Tax=Microbispora siamensis TaxID=564413 RepID=A0ABQ4GXJ4_9ACTN|nr:hypothetical protein [Microbispora siamensis]GIH66153.1 hypothetical protein Msi02_69700 [Microbispora siamensis]